MPNQVGRVQSPVLSVNNLVAGYGNKTIIRNLFFNLEKPCFLAITGHNGAGKTTLFNIYNQFHPYSGTVKLFGEEVAKAETGFVRSKIAALAQRSAVNFSISVSDLVVTGRFRHKTTFADYNTEDTLLAREALQQMGIAHLANRDFTTLSGGEQQLVWLAHLQLQDCPVMLLDEPTQYLDLYNRKSIFAQLWQWVCNGKTVVCITHDIEYLQSVPQGYILYLGKADWFFEPLTPQNLELVKERLEQRE